MALVLVFASGLPAAVLLSGLANRTVLSTAVLFLVAGFLFGDGVLIAHSSTDVVIARWCEPDVDPDGPFTSQTA